MKKASSLRSKRGISLITVMLIGMVSTMWVGALFSTVMPTFQKISGSKQDFTLRNGSEMAIDWAIQQLNTSGLGNGIDVPANALINQSKTTSVPYSNLVTGSSVPITASVTVTNSQPMPGSSLYDSNTYYPANLTPGTAHTNGLTRNYWRVVDSTATIGTTPPKRSRIRVILRPNMNITTAQSVTPDAGILTADSAQLAPNYVTNSYFSGSGGSVNPASFSDSRGDVISNGLIDVNQGTIGGHAISYRLPSEGTGIISGSQGLVKGKARANSTITVPSNKILGQMPTNPDGTPMAVSATQEQLDLSNNSIQNMNPQMSKATLQAPPSHPATGVPIAGGGTLNSSMTLVGPGEYYLNKIDLTGNKVITISGTGPVKIWVEGAGASISLAGQAKFQNATGKPENLQIFFPNTGNISMAGGAEFRGIIYAPQATVSMNGGAAVYGAIIGKSVNFNGGGNSGALHYDTALDNLQLFQTQASTSFQNFTVVSWQELPDYLP